VTPRHLGRLALLVPLSVIAAAVAGCGSSSGPATVTIQKARQFQITDLQPSAPVAPDKPTTVSFRILQPSGVPMTRFRTGSGPHTGVHLILVRDDLGVIIHRHPPVGPGGRFTQKITFPTPGPYRLLLDVYPALSGGQAAFQQTNFQLFDKIRVKGGQRPRPLPPETSTQTIDGYRFRIRPHPALRAIEPQLMTINVTDPSGKPVTFTPWYGALAHAIFFRKGTLDYFHTHVCSPGAGGCTSVLGGTRVTGSSTKPGRLTVGVLVPLPGTWRLFLQTKANGRVLTAPFTLHVGEPGSG
jgi:hypothetical protein